MANGELADGTPRKLDSGFAQLRPRVLKLRMGRRFSEFGRIVAVSGLALFSVSSDFEFCSLLRDGITSSGGLFEVEWYNGKLFWSLIDMTRPICALDFQVYLPETSFSPSFSA